MATIAGMFEHNGEEPAAKPSRSIMKQKQDSRLESRSESLVLGLSSLLSSSSSSAWHSHAVIHWILPILYVAATLLSLFMASWILVFPSSWLMGRWKWHDDLVYAFYDKYGHHIPYPHETFTKYAGHGIVQLTHIFPGALWALIVPFQLNPGFRNSHKRVHRFLGFLFFATCFHMAVGYVLIQVKKLTFLDDYPELPPLPRWRNPFLSLNVAMAWFVFTAIKAWKKAVQRDFATHQEYIFRHVGAGLWIAIQRLVITWINPRNRAQQRALFWQIGFVAFFFSCAVAELAVHVVREERKTTKATTMTEKEK